MAVIAALLLMVLSTTVVGVALLRLSLRTRHSPEALMATALLLVGPIGQPLTYASGSGRLPAGEVDIVLSSLAAAVIIVGLGCLFFFTARVFYRESILAHLLASLGTLVVGVCYVGATAATAVADPTLASGEVMQTWSLGIQAPLLLCFGWPAWAASREHSRMRKRASLGLSDPAVANRFLLFATAMGAAFLMMVITIGLRVLEIGSANDLTSRFVISVGSTINAISMYLAFVPPRTYVGWIRGTVQP